MPGLSWDDTVASGVNKCVSSQKKRGLGIEPGGDTKRWEKQRKRNTQRRSNRCGQESRELSGKWWDGSQRNIYFKSFFKRRAVNNVKSYEKDKKNHEWKRVQLVIAPHVCSDLARFFHILRTLITFLFFLLSTCRHNHDDPIKQHHLCLPSDHYVLWPITSQSMPSTSAGNTLPQA